MEEFKYECLNEIGRENLEGTVVDSIELVSMIDGLMENNMHEGNADVLATMIKDLIFSHRINK